MNNRRCQSLNDCLTYTYFPEQYTYSPSALSAVRVMIENKMNVIFILNHQVFSSNLLGFCDVLIKQKVAVCEIDYSERYSVINSPF